MDDHQREAGLRAWVHGTLGDLLEGVDLEVRRTPGGRWLDESGRMGSPLRLTYDVLLDIPHTNGDPRSGERANELAARLQDAADVDPSLGGVLANAGVELSLTSSPFVRPGRRRVVLHVAAPGAVSGG